MWSNTLIYIFLHLEIMWSNQNHIINYLVKHLVVYLSPIISLTPPYSTKVLWSKLKSQTLIPCKVWRDFRLPIPAFVSGKSFICKFTAKIYFWSSFSSCLCFYHGQQKSKVSSRHVLFYNSHLNRMLVKFEQNYFVCTIEILAFWPKVFHHVRQSVNAILEHVFGTETNYYLVPNF